MARRPPKKRQGPRPPRAPRQSSDSRKGNLQQQVIQLQEQMMEAQESLKDETVSASSGGGMVTVVANGHQDVVSITIDPEVVDPEDVEFLQDMVLAAVNEALTISRDMASERMSGFTGGLDIPGLT